MLMEFSQEIKIGSKTIRTGGPCFVIAEAGINHNGSMDLARQLANLAIAAGADAVKFQTFIADQEVTKKLKKVAYQKSDAGDEESYYDMIKKWEFNEQQHRELMAYCAEKGIIFLSTPSEEVSARLLHKLDVSAYKIGSNDLVTLPMIEEIAGWGKPMILSTGMADMAEVKEALATVSAAGNQNVIVLQCTSSYPTAPENMNVSVVKTLRDTFDVLVGLSDHSIGLEAAPLAVLLGAVVVEKHITVDRTLPGPDQSMALDLADFTAFVRSIREVEGLSAEEREKRITSYPNAQTLLGNSEKKPTPAELDMRHATRKGIVARSHIKAGEIITREMLAFKRPYDGMPAREYKMVLGKEAVADIPEEEYITSEMLV